ncbi:hypothetical protein BDR06DRAFT_1032718 [Suillus hirtellus]|nr:hypothetical protein BDR06DRAFT_1032718 [Suillus hirtellus]
MPSPRMYINSAPQIPIPLQIWRIHTVLMASSSIILVTQLWKKARIHLKAIYTSILTLSPSHKIAIDMPQRCSLSKVHFDVLLQHPTLPAPTIVSLTLIFWSTTK